MNEHSTYIKQLQHMTSQIKATATQRMIQRRGVNQLTIEEIKRVRDAACALATAAKAECDFYNNLILELEPPQG